MSTGIILTISFLAEAMLLAIGIVVFLFIRLKKLKTSQAALEAAANADDEPHKTLTELFDDQINRTRKEIAGQKQGELDKDQESQKELLNKRIDYLNFEKEISDEHITDKTYWGKIYSQLSDILTINITTPEDKPDTPQEQDPSSNDDFLKKRLAKYREQFSTLYREFEEYRKRAKKITGSLSETDKDAEQDAALMELMADFKSHDERLHSRMAELQRENEQLEKNLNSSEIETQKLGHQIKQDSHEPISKASEEEINRLRDIIGRQYGSIDELKVALQSGNGDDEHSTVVAEKIQAVEASQQELKTCVEILEMENQRLTDALESAQQTSGNSESGDSGELSKQLEEKDQKIKSMEEEYEALQEEFMNLYSSAQG